MLQAAHEDLEPLPERLVTEVVEPGPVARVVDQIVVLRHVFPR